MKLGIKLKNLRVYNRYSQSYVAHYLQMSQGNYCKLERDHHLPTLQVIEVIAALYKMPIYELLAQDEK